MLLGHMAIRRGYLLQTLQVVIDCSIEQFQHLFVGFSPDHSEIQRDRAARFLIDLSLRMQKSAADAFEIRYPFPDAFDVPFRKVEVKRGLDGSGVGEEILVHECAIISCMAHGRIDATWGLGSALPSILLQSITEKHNSRDPSQESRLLEA